MRGEDIGKGVPARMMRLTTMKVDVAGRAAGAPPATHLSVVTGPATVESVTGTFTGGEFRAF